MPKDQSYITVNSATSEHFYCPAMTRRLPQIEARLRAAFIGKTISVFDAYRNKRHGTPEVCRCIDIVRRENWFMLVTDGSTFTKNELVMVDEVRGMAVFFADGTPSFYRIVSVT